MTFLAPLFLLGTLAIAGPIIVHLIRRSTKEQTPFSSLMFLQPTPPRVTRRSRLENLWLLLLRCLVILLLAFSFARPLWQEATPTPPAPNSQKRSIVLIDASASMKRGNLWQNARERVEAVVKQAAPADEIALLSFGRATTPLVSFEQWRSIPVDERVPMALQRLQALEPTWGATSLGSAMLEAAELLDSGRDAVARAEIVLITDLQEGAKLEGLQGFGWPKGIHVKLEPVQTDQLDNASVQWLSDQSATTEGEAKLRLRVQSSAAAKREQYRLQWDSSPAAGLDVYVPAGQARIAHAPPRPAGATKVLLTGDAVNFDNTLFIVPPEPAKVVVLFLGKDQPNDAEGALYYLHRGFPSTAQQVIQVVARAPDPPPAAIELAGARLLVLGEGLTEATISAAREVANSGRIVLYPVASASAGPALARLLAVPELKLEEARGGKHALIGNIDFTDPIFAPFADPRYSDFTKIRFWKHRKFTVDALPGAKVIARFDNQSPALVQVPVGRGSIVVLATTWRPADSQLALSSKFVPLLHSLLDQSSGLQPQRAQYFVGDPVQMPGGPEAFKVRAPSGKETEVAADGTFSATDEPGVYVVTPGEKQFVVNLTPEESRVQPMDAARLAALGVPLEDTQEAAAEKPAPNPAAIQAAEIESRQKLWRWLLLAAVVVLLLETPIAARLSEVPRQPVST